MEVSQLTAILPLLEWLDIPAGRVTLTDTAEALDIKPFRIAKYPVTNEQFQLFIQDGGYKNAAWWTGLDQTIKTPRASDWPELDCPKLQICWYEAIAFCHWLTDKIGFDVRLPTEWEWQWAAVGDSGWDYPYGPTFDAAKCNTKEMAIGRTNVVTRFSEVQTCFGTTDMSGNVLEWCLNEGIAVHNVQISGGENRALRGGSWNSLMANARVAFRSHKTPRTRTFNIGFRVIMPQQF